MELMVVVALVAILTVLAVPAMRVARDDRVCFDYARQISSLIHHGRTRAAGRGAAHLVVVETGGTNHGRALLFEALDGTGGATGPNPVSSCKTAGQWAFADGFVPGTTDPLNFSRIVEGVNLNGNGVNTDAQIFATASINNAAAGAILLVCMTPGGTTYAATGVDFPTAVAAMQASLPFADVVEIDVQRHNGAPPGGTGIGMKRRVLVAGAGAPRIKSE